MQSDLSVSQENLKKLLQLYWNHYLHFVHCSMQFVIPPPSLQLPYRCLIEPQEMNEVIQFCTYTHLLSIEVNISIAATIKNTNKNILDDRYMHYLVGCWVQPPHMIRPHLFKLPDATLSNVLERRQIFSCFTFKKQKLSFQTLFDKVSYMCIGL